MLKRESTLLLERIADAANEIEQAMKPLFSLSPEGAANAYQIVQDRARSIRFDTMRLITLVEDDSSVFCDIYEFSLRLVDGLREIRGTAMLSDAENNDLAEIEIGIAEMQEDVEALFPNDTLAG